MAASTHLGELPLLWNADQESITISMTTTMGSGDGNGPEGYRQCVDCQSCGGPQDGRNPDGQGLHRSISFGLLQCMSAVSFVVSQWHRHGNLTYQPRPLVLAVVKENDGSRGNLRGGLGFATGTPAQISMSYQHHYLPLSVPTRFSFDLGPYDGQC